MSEWISVEDSLPLDDAFVLCAGIGQSCRDVFIGYIDMRGSWFEHNNGDYIDGGYGGDYGPIVVTHWQPLPTPPRQPAE